MAVQIFILARQLRATYSEQNECEHNHLHVLYLMFMSTDRKKYTCMKTEPHWFIPGSKKETFGPP